MLCGYAAAHSTRNRKQGTVLLRGSTAARRTMNREESTVILRGSTAAHSIDYSKILQGAMGPQNRAHCVGKAKHHDSGVDRRTQ